MYGNTKLAEHLVHPMGVAVPVVVHVATWILVATLVLPTQPNGSRGRLTPAPVTVPQIRENSKGASRWTLDELFAALRVVETGGSENEGRHAVGDRGRAIGPLQIQRAYWKDSRVPGTYEDCRDLEYARAVVMSYWRRYCPRALEALDAKVLARVHNGGPGGREKACTEVFWRKVERELLSQRRRAGRDATGSGTKVPGRGMPRSGSPASIDEEGTPFLEPPVRRSGSARGSSWHDAPDGGPRQHLDLRLVGHATADSESVWASSIVHPSAAARSWKDDSQSL